MISEEFCKNLNDNQRQLVNIMSSVSEREYGAGWRDENEYWIWWNIEKIVKFKALGGLYLEEIANILYLSIKANGWVITNEDKEGGLVFSLQPISFSDWLIIYEKWMVKMSTLFFEDQLCNEEE
jgi:hypothetical protein